MLKEKDPLSINSSMIYIGCLAVALILTYIEGLGQTAAVVYYISLCLLITCLILDSSFIRPVYIYLFMANMYVIFITEGLWFDRMLFNPYLEIFTKAEFLEGFRICLVSLLGIAFPLARGKSKEIYKPSKPQGDYASNVVYTKALLFLNMLAIVGEGLYIYTNRKLFLESYILSIRHEVGYKEAHLMAMPVEYFDNLIFSFSLLYIVYNTKWSFSKLFWSEVVLFSMLHMMTGSRKLMVILWLLIFWRYYTQHGIKWLDRTLVKLGGLVLALLFMGCIGVWRSTNLEFTILQALIYISNEFSFGIISTLYSVHYFWLGVGPPLFLPLLDGITGLIPTFLIPEKLDLLIWRSWLDSIGGHEKFCPIGGVHLPSQLYLFTGSLLGVFVFFYLFSLFLQQAYRNLFADRKIDIMRGLTAASMISIFSLRSEFWLQLKMIILWWGVLPLSLYFISEIMLLKGRYKPTTITLEAI